MRHTSSKLSCIERAVLVALAIAMAVLAVDFVLHMESYLTTW